MVRRSPVRAHFPVSVRAVVQRINRKLKPSLKQLQKCRAGRYRQELGDYFIVDLNRNLIVATRVDLEVFGRELRVLDDWERVSDE